MRYSKRTLKITSLNDFINLKSRQAILLTLRSVEAMKTDVKAGESFRQAAIMLLSEEQAASNPGDTPTIQIDGFTSGGLSSFESIEC
jgi:hypothetical protein